MNDVDFKSKVTNIFIQYLTCIMKNDLSDVEHFIKEQPKEYANSIITNMINHNRRQMYDELNVSNINMTNKEETDKEVVYSISLLAKYLDYQLDLSNGNIVAGTDDHRIERTYYLKIVKKIDTKEETNIKRCPGCGHSLDVNYSGKCEYCGRIFNQEDYDYQLLEIR